MLVTVDQVESGDVACTSTIMQIPVRKRHAGWPRYDVDDADASQNITKRSLVMLAVCLTGIDGTPECVIAS